MKARQRGVALISVLLVMSLALLIIGGVLRSHHLLLQSSGQQVQQLHLRQLGVTGESWALAMLQKDSDPMAERNASFDLDGAQIQIEIEDMAGRFNLNTLLIQGQTDQVTLNRWSRLLALLELPEVRLEQVGALRELSQVRLLSGIDGHWLRRLEPWVALLPTDAALNINTAPSLLLRSLDGIDAATADALVQRRTPIPWSSVQAFTRDPLLAGAGVSSHGLGIDSRWSRIKVQVAHGPHRLRLATDVERDAKTGQINLLQRRLLPSNPQEMTP